MKKPLRYMLSVMLMLALMLSMGTAAFADKTDSELPVEYVTYGVGLPDAPGVDRHELGDDDITIDGVSWRTKTSEDKLYVYVLDLAAAKLLRGCTGEAKELGIDYAKLYIENGLIQVKENVPTAEAEELRARLDKLTYAAVIGVVAGDVFDVGSGGDVKLQVVVTGFVTGAQETEASKSGLDVKGIGVVTENGETDMEATIKKGMDAVSKIERTTVFIIYGGTTEYYSDWTPPKYSLETDNDQPADDGDALLTHTNKSGWVGIANAKDDNTKYYIKVIGLNGDGGGEYVQIGDLSKVDPSANPDDFDGMLVSIIGNKDGELADRIIVSTDGTDDGIVMTIDLKDGTAKQKDLYDEEGLLMDAAPDGYEEPDNKEDYNVVYEPSVNEDGSKNDIVIKVEGDTAEVTVRDTVTAENSEDGGEIDIS